MITQRIMAVGQPDTWLTYEPTDGGYVGWSDVPPPGAVQLQDLIVLWRETQRFRGRSPRYLVNPEAATDDAV